MRVFDPNASWYLNKALLQCCIQNEKEKKRQYNEQWKSFRNLPWKFSPLPPPALVFSIYGGVGRKCSTFYNRLAKKMAQKQKNENYINQSSQIGYKFFNFSHDDFPIFPMMNDIKNWRPCLVRDSLVDQSMLFTHLYLMTEEKAEAWSVSQANRIFWWEYFSVCQQIHKKIYPLVRC